jgi:hypothetical protein
VKIRTPFRGLALRGDRYSLRLAHTLLFRAAHPRVAPPEASVVGTAGASSGA